MPSQSDKIAVPIFPVLCHGCIRDYL